MIAFYNFNEKEKLFNSLLKKMNMNNVIPTTTNKGKIKLLENGKTYKDDNGKILYDLDIINYICEVNCIIAEEYNVINEIIKLYEEESKI